jgi:hypothetical protein
MFGRMTGWLLWARTAVVKEAQAGLEAVIMLGGCQVDFVQRESRLFLYVGGWLKRWFLADQ